MLKIAFENAKNSTENNNNNAKNDVKNCNDNAKNDGKSNNNKESYEPYELKIIIKTRWAKLARFLSKENHYKIMLGRVNMILIKRKSSRCQKKSNNNAKDNVKNNNLYDAKNVQI